MMMECFAYQGILRERERGEGGRKLYPY